MKPCGVRNSPILLSLLLQCVLVSTVKVTKSNNLLLTPFIESGRLREAWKLAQVHNTGNSSSQLLSEYLSYSGFITVDSSCQSNLFFWFFPVAVS